jgi:hypothetical protein
MNYPWYDIGRLSKIENTLFGSLRGSLLDEIEVKLNLIIQ